MNIAHCFVICVCTVDNVALSSGYQCIADVLFTLGLGLLTDSLNTAQWTFNNAELVIDMTKL